MLGFASVNRFWLTPRPPTSREEKAAQLLCVSTTAEIALGFTVICVVAVLGQMEPAGHVHTMMLRLRSVWFASIHDAALSLGTGAGDTEAGRSSRDRRQAPKAPVVCLNAPSAGRIVSLKFIPPQLADRPVAPNRLCAAI